MCKSWCELIIAILVVVFALWNTIYSKWILVILGVILAIHSFTCKTCFVSHGAEMKSGKSRRR